MNPVGVKALRRVPLIAKRIADPALLAEIRDSVVGRGARGITYLEAKLAGLHPGDAATASASADVHVLVAALLRAIEITQRRQGFRILDAPPIAAP